MKQRLWISLSSSLLAGSMIGTIEAFVLLLGVGAGEYDALFWGAFGYGVGASVFIPIWVVVSLFPFFRTLSGFQIWSIFFCLTSLVLFSWVFSTAIWTMLFVAAILPFTFWIVYIFLSRTPLKILLTVKGMGIFYCGFLLVLSVFSLTPGRNIYAPPIRVEQSLGRNNILLLLIDGLRMDHLRIGMTPALDSFGHKSVIFERTFANAPTSFGSVAGLFSGQIIIDDSPLEDQQSTLAEHLAYNGYQTFAIMNQPELGRFSNLHQGFDFFRFLPPFSPIPLNEGARRLKLFKELFFYWAEMSADPNRLYRPSRDVFFHLRKEIELRSQNKAPWFAVAQIREAQPPLFYQQPNGSYNRPIWPGKAAPDDSSRAYADEIRRVDHNFGRFLLFLRQSKLDKNTIVVVTSSISTQLQPHPNHSMHRPNPYHLQVPLFISAPNIDPKRIKQSVQLMDVPKTLSSMIGLDPHPNWSGANILRLQPHGKHRPIYASFNDSNGQWDMVQQGAWKYIRHDHSREELYNIEQDPFEMTNLINRDQEQRQRMYELLQRREE